MNRSYRKYLRNLINDNIINVTFTKSTCANEPDHLCSNKANEYALASVMKQSEAENYRDFFNAAQLVRNEIEKHEKWKLTGSFNDYVVLKHLGTLVRWIIVGPHTKLCKDECQQSVDKSILIAIPTITVSI